MAHIKDDSERGPFGAWAYHARTRLELSDEQVVRSLPTRWNPATLRKLEGGTGSAKMRAEVVVYYQSQALKRGLALPDPPAATAVALDPTQELIAALHAQTLAMTELVNELRLAREDQQDRLKGIEQGLANIQTLASSPSSSGRRSPVVARP